MTTNFIVPAGSYLYTVDVNQTFGEWDATKVSMKDTLSSDKMEYTGYAKVEAYTYNATTKQYEIHETKWVVLIFQRKRRKKDFSQRKKNKNTIKISSVKQFD